MTVQCKQENCIENYRAVAARVQGDFEEEEAKEEFSVSVRVCITKWTWTSSVRQRHCTTFPIDL